MSDITLVTANKVEVVESIIQMTLPAAEAITAGQAVRLDTSTGKFTKANSTSSAEARIWGIATATVPAGVPVTAVRRGVLDGFDLSAMNYDEAVFLSGTDGALSDGDPSTNEQQVVTLVNDPTGGTFTLTFDGEETDPIAYNAANTDVDAALEALSTIGVGNVAVTGNAGGPWTVTFQGDLADTNVPGMTGDGSSLTGDAYPPDPDVEITTGASGVEVHEVGRVIPATGTTLGTAFDKILLVDL